MKKAPVNSGRNGIDWLRSWRRKLHNPKVRSLTPEQYRAWDLLLCMTDKDGFLPRLRDVAYHLHVPIDAAEHRIRELVDLEFIDLVGDMRAPRYRMHDWDTWQGAYETSKDRMRRLRIRRKNRTTTENVTSRDGSGDASQSGSGSSTEHVSSSVARAESAQRVFHEEDRHDPETSPRPTGRPIRGGRS